MEVVVPRAAGVRRDAVQRLAVDGKRRGAAPVDHEVEVLLRRPAQEVGFADWQSLGLRVPAGDAVSAEDVHLAPLLRLELGDGGEIDLI